MTRSRTVLLLSLAALLFVLGVFSLGVTVGRGDGSALAFFGTSRPDGFSVVEEAYERIRETAVDPPSERQLARGAIEGMIRVLQRSEDPYAFFYGPRGYRSFRELMTGEFTGVGVWLKRKKRELRIISVLPSTPARAAGLRRGDTITSINGHSVEGMTIEEAVTRIKGRRGTAVSLGVEREGESLSFTLTRATIELPNVKVRMEEGNLGYLRLFGFAKGAGDQLVEEVGRLIDKGAQGLVLDLRDNGGGLFSEAIEVASVFIEGGEIVTYRERSEPDRVYEARGDAFDDVPLVVLVNEGTASASEIVAGALKDRDRAVLIGSTTYGKGSVQEVLPLGDSSALKLTTAAYLTPDGQNINGTGIAPDVEISGRQRQQRRAMAILRRLVASDMGAQG